VHSGEDLGASLRSVLGYRQESVKGKAIQVAPITSVASDSLAALLDLCDPSTVSFQILRRDLLCCYDSAMPLEETSEHHRKGLAADKAGGRGPWHSMGPALWDMLCCCRTMLRISISLEITCLVHQNTLFAETFLGGCRKLMLMPRQGWKLYWQLV